MWYQFWHVWMGQMTSALELQPYLYNNDDPWKKFDSLSTEIAPTATKMVKFGPKKAYRHFKHSKWAVLRNLSLIPSITMIGEKKWGVIIPKKLRTENTPKNYGMVASYRFLVFRQPNFFSPIIVIDGIRLKFWSTAHLECLKYPYWDMLFLVQIWPF